jgi:caffeoyl-CoA O-methyltransferase
MTQADATERAAARFHPRPAASATAPKSFLLSPEAAGYIAAHCGEPAPVLAALSDETRRIAGDKALMQVAPEQGALLSFLARTIHAESALELGTFTGYSAICIALGLAEGGVLDTVDLSDEWTAVARQYVERAGVQARVRFHCASAASFLRSLSPERRFDLVFFDADKPHYLEHYETVLPLLRRGGLLVVDNVLWGGRVFADADPDEWTRAIHRFNTFIATDERVDRVMLGVADGLTLIRKR